MSARIQGLLAVLALGALIALLFVSSTVRRSIAGLWTANVSTAVTVSCANTHGLPACDDDHDGLTNAQEAYWHTDPANPDTDGDGYLDGEEVLTGHNPLVKGPDDWLDPGRNLTQRTVTLALGGILNGDLNPATASYQQSVSVLAGAMADQFKKNAVVTVDKVTTTSNDPVAVQQYLKVMMPLLGGVIAMAYHDNAALLESIGDVPLNNTAILTDDATRYGAFIQTTQRLSDLMGQRAIQLAAIPVPPEFAATHTFAIRLMRTLQKYYQLLGDLKDDPLQGTIIIGSLIQIQFKSFVEYVQAYDQALMASQHL